MASIQETCGAKVNLGLIIKGKRPDGYHLLQTLFYPVDVRKDDISIHEIRGKECEVMMAGFDETLPLEQNLCYKAWALLQSEFPDKVGGVRIEVVKRIPSGAGMAGGSSDAAGVMRGLNKLFNLGLGSDALAALGIRLGADVPFFFYTEPMFAEGVGEKLSPWPIDLSGYRWEFSFPGIHSSTPAAFRALDWSVLQPETELRDILRMPVSNWREHLRNDLEGPVFKQYPALAGIKEEFYRKGAIYASMTGSGSGIFALFE